MKYIYVITMIVDIIENSRDSKWSRIGRSRTLAWYPTKKKAIDAVLTNEMDLRDNDHKYAVVEKYLPGAWTACKQEWWFEWDDDKECYLPIDKPYCVSCIINFGIG